MSKSFKPKEEPKSSSLASLNLSVPNDAGLGESSSTRSNARTTDVIDVDALDAPNTSSHRAATAQSSSKGASETPTEHKIRKRSAAEKVVEGPFEKFDVEGTLAAFEDDTRSALEFEREVTERMLSLMLSLRVWAECRPAHEDNVQSAKLSASLDAIEDRELKQETTRLSLVTFLASIREALKILTNPAPSA
ncbi:hypothetical protein DL93DRAFT_2095690 [Clavulina sp. PMI_390]|nr:hypothetical protein DL93DRAFT_2095690 [Clavulina sp. PMI_390]